MQPRPFGGHGFLIETITIGYYNDFVIGIDWPMTTTVSPVRPNADYNSNFKGLHVLKIAVSVAFDADVIQYPAPMRGGA